MAHIDFNPSDSIIVVDVVLETNIVVTTRMVLDTGASYMMIPIKAAETLNLKIDTRRTIETTTASMTESIPMVKIPKVNALGQEVKNVEALVKDLPSEAGIDGLLGLSFLRHFNVNIDFKHGKLTLKR